MDKNYDVDDILAEIKRKKADRQTGIPNPPPVASPPPVPPVQANRRPAPKSPAPGGFPFDAVSAQAGRGEEPPAYAQPKERTAPKNPKITPFNVLSLEDDWEDEEPAPRMDEPKQGNPERGFSSRFRKPAEQAAPPEQEEESRAIPFPASQRTAKARPAMEEQLPKTHWDVYDNLDELSQEKNDGRTRMDLPRLNRLGKDPEEAVGFGDATQELPVRLGRRLGRGNIQMDFGMDDEDEPIRETAVMKNQSDLEPINDYNSPEDKAAIVADFIKIKKGLLLRLGFSMILLLVSLYLSLSASIQALPLPEFMWPEGQLRNFITVHTVIGVISMLVCSNIVGAGLISLFKMRSDTDTLPALAGIAAVVQGIVYLSRPEEAAAYTGSLLFSVTILCFIFNLLGKIMLSNRIVRNFKLVSSDCVKYSMGIVENKSLLRGLTKGITLESYEIAYPQPAVHLAAFLDNSYSEDQTDSLYRILAPVCLAGAVAIAIVTFFVGGKEILPVAHAFAAILAVCASFTGTLVVNLPMDRLSTLLTREGGMVSGYSAVEQCSHLDGVTLFDHDLIRPDNVVLHGIKTFDESRIDEVIIDAASVILSREGTLTAVFNQLVGGNLKMLRPVDTLVYEDAMGISAWVDGKHVLIGNRELLQHHGITPPPMEFEKRFHSDEREVLYLSNSGLLSAMFVMSYRADEETLKMTDRLARQEMYLFIHSCDPNLTAAKVSRLLDYPQELVRIFPANVHDDYEEQRKLRDKAPAGVGFMGKNTTMLKAILGAISVKGCITLAIILQIIAVMLGYGLLTFLAIRGDLGMISFTHLLLYHGVWTAMILLIPNLRKLL